MCGTASRQREPYDDGADDSHPDDDQYPRPYRHVSLLLLDGDCPEALPRRTYEKTVGIWLAATGVRHLGKQWRMNAALNADHELVTSGPYRIVRHPIYASMFAMMIMCILLLGKLPWWPIAIALFLTGIEIRIHAEDGLLRERFGVRFEDWKSKVPAYVPLLR